jgi:hypothetical protein
MSAFDWAKGSHAREAAANAELAYEVLELLKLISTVRFLGRHNPLIFHSINRIQNDGARNTGIRFQSSAATT